MEETVDELGATRFFEADIAFYESYDHEAFQREVDKEAREEGIKEIIKKNARVQLKNITYFK